jgi:chaperonin GroEL
MNNKELNFGEENRIKLLKGVTILADAVGSTLGPAGRNVIIEKEYQNPISTKDGVTVAKEIQLVDKFENIGVQVIKEAASQTNDMAGDGTTTSTILAHAIITEGMKFVTAGSNPVELKRGIDKAVKYVVKQLQAKSHDIADENEIKQIAMISANNDEAIGTLISEAMKSVGRDGVITVENSKTAESSLDVVEGMQFQRGYLSPYFINNNELMQVQMEDPYILLYDRKINDTKELLKLLEQVIQKNRPLLVIADDIEGQALAVLIVNKMRGTIKCAAVKSPEYGARKLQILEDIAILTGGRVISPDKGDKLDKITLADLGTSRLITIDNKNTTIIDGKGDTEEIKTRIEEIKKLIDNSTSDYEKEKLQERLGKLAGGVAVLNIGAETELEMLEKKDRVDDALHATRAAIEEGIIVGGGIPLYTISQNKNFISEVGDLSNTDQELGAKIILKAIQKPFCKILENAGITPEVVWKDIQQFIADEFIFHNEDVKNSVGYDVRNEKVVDMFKAGIIDPIKVTRVALEKAASVAGIVLTTECTIVSIPEKANNQQQYMGE